MVFIVGVILGLVATAAIADADVATDLNVVTVVWALFLCFN